jgi:uncharacterized protein
MPQIDSFDVGTFCWAELSTSDEAGARDFYSAVFGWDVDVNEIPGGTYSTFMKGGRSVAAAAQQREEEAAGGVPPHWNLYVSVDDADAFAAKASSAGGNVIAPPFDVMELGRMAVISDPTGAVLGLWQDKAMGGYGVIDDPGTVNWHELMTPDLAKARAFYSELFGWEIEEYPMPRGTYTVFKSGEASRGGATATPENLGNLAAWTVYFEVEDCDGTVEKIKGAGGSVQFGPEFAETVGKFATIADPQGASFAILEPDPNVPQ